MPGIKCPQCLSEGTDVWVIPGKNCHKCGTASPRNRFNSVREQDNPTPEDGKKRTGNSSLPSRKKFELPPAVIHIARLPVVFMMKRGRRQIGWEENEK
ncbi:hypothetical protein AnigIFM63604_004351 [Aspergillus niger]|nr:uncharacterized protein BO96DRAFT_329613 [Aspergillus niger CBS 101883]PYH59886.1 hypothetical protein BO96DRAFT_329613 [Aspergillus niger CBS 101883]GLA48785.1 hypothetical protein AnigIFM63604_004351 [Aspergillus niger]